MSTTKLEEVFGSYKPGYTLLVVVLTTYKKLELHSRYFAFLRKLVRNFNVIHDWSKSVKHNLLLQA